MMAGRRVPRLLSAVGVLIAALLLEALALCMVAGAASEPLRLLSAGAAHVAASGFCAEGLRLRAPDPEVGASMYRAGWLLGLGFPLFGVLICLVMATYRHRGQSRGVDAESLEKRRSRAARAALEKRRTQQQLGAGIDAIVDALKDRDAKVRVAAVDALRDESSKRAVKFLSRSRTNTVFDVRFRAVESLNRISKEHGDRIAKAKKEWAEDPSSPELHGKLAGLCLEYGLLGLENQTTRTMLLEQAVEHAAAAVELGDGDRAAALTHGTALRELDRLDEAELCYRQLLARNKFDVEAGLGLLEVQFLRKDLAALPDTCRQLLRHAGPALDPATIDALKLWIRSAKPVAARV